MSIGKMKDIRYHYVIIEINYLAMEKEDTVIQELTDIFILAGYILQSFLVPRESLNLTGYVLSDVETWE